MYGAKHAGGMGGVDAAPVAPEVLRITATRSITKIYFGYVSRS
jgi:hypothetical protein